MELFTSLSPTDPVPRRDPVPGRDPVPRRDPVPGRDGMSIEIAVVIDVLRATTVATTAIGAGASAILTCADIDEAKRLAAEHSPALLCGERGCRPIAGFDLGNSPTEYGSSVVSGRTLVMTTTNGTRAVAASASADGVLLGSFLNLSAIVDAVSEAASVHLVCAGTDGHLTGEDVLLAGAIAESLMGRKRSARACDATSIAIAWWRDRVGQNDAAKLTNALASTRGGRNLIAVGYGDDLARCAAIDSLSIVPRRTTRTPARFEST